MAGLERYRPRSVRRAEFNRRYPQDAVLSVTSVSPPHPANFMVCVDRRKNNEWPISMKPDASKSLINMQYNHYSHQFRLGLLTYSAPPRMTRFPPLPSPSQRWFLSATPVGACHWAALRRAREVRRD